MKDKNGIKKGLFEPRVKLLFVKEEKLFGPGICELLEKIGSAGSIQAAAAEMEMSYSKAWKILRRAEKGLGIRLLNRTNGGREGGSSTLTKEAEYLVQSYRAMEGRLQEMSEALLEEYFGA